MSSSGEIWRLLPGGGPLRTLLPQFHSSRVLKRIHQGLFQSHLFQMCVAESALQNIVDLLTQVLGSRYGSRKPWQRVQVLVIKALQDLALDELIQIDQIADHAGALIHRPANRDFERVAVTVSMGVVALAEDALVFVRRELRVVVVMRS